MFRTWIVSCVLIAASLCAESPLTLFKIDPAARAPDIATIVATFNAAPYVSKLSEVGIQTGSGFIYSPIFAPYVQNGFIPYVQSAISSTNGTLLIVGYLPNGSSTKTQYLVVPIEKMAAVMYSPRAITPPGISTPYPQGELPRYDVDPVLRALDLAAVFTSLNTASIYQTGQNSVGIFTTLNAAFNPPIVNGFIPNVQAITVSGAYLIIDYLPTSLNGRTFVKTNATIVVSAEQVRQMVYYENRLYSATGV